MLALCSKILFEWSLGQETYLCPLNSRKFEARAAGTLLLAPHLFGLAGRPGLSGFRFGGQSGRVPFKAKWFAGNMWVCLSFGGSLFGIVSEGNRKATSILFLFLLGFVILSPCWDRT